MSFFRLCIIVIVLCLTALYWMFWKSSRLVRKIPGPRSWPFIGNTWSIIKTTENLFPYLRTLYKDFGNISQMHGLTYKAVHIFNPDDIEKILSSSRFNYKQQPYTFFQPWLGDGLLISNGAKWQQRRKLLTGAFHFNILKKYTRTFIDRAQNFLQEVEKETWKQKTDVVPLVCKTTLQIMCETAMGTSMNEGIKNVTNKYLEAIHAVGQCIMRRICRVWLYPDAVFFFTKTFWLQEKAVRDLHRFTEEIIEERRIYIEDNSTIDCDINESSKGRLAMLDLLLEKEKQGEIDRRGTREEVDTFMFEGHDTTAMALSFMIMRIANEPEVQHKIYEELFDIFGNSDRQPTSEDLNAMKYLECCIKESLRLYPSVPLIVRYTTEESELGGFTIPVDTICHIYVYDLHRRADLFPEPEKFIPERFYPENCQNRHPFSYIPFSAGYRNCIGQRFAMLEMKILISGLLRRYQLLPITKPADLVFKADIILRTNSPIYVRFCKRV
ncbi:unnamed protein product [Leptosia nina]|uniref:Cytochrome P450 n=1 Tax=Leptosia nina TaxID=320188 RepID=A0AAV1JLY2_9NEOP